APATPAPQPTVRQRIAPPPAAAAQPPQQVASSSSSASSRRVPATEITVAPRGAGQIGAGNEFALPARSERDPREWKPDPGILSAKELAAAFQLEFSPGGPAHAPRRSSAASAVKRPKASPPRSRRGRVLVALLLLAILGGGAALYLRPDWRAQT